MNPQILIASIEGIRLLTQAIEAAQNGSEAEALEYLRQVQDRVIDADTAWQAAGD
jgi:hypothetical protein